MDEGEVTEYSVKVLGIKLDMRQLQYLKILVKADVIEITVVQVIATQIQTPNSRVLDGHHQLLGVSRCEVRVGQIQVFQCKNRIREDTQVHKSKIIEGEIRFFYIFSPATFPKKTVDLFGFKVCGGKTESLTMQQTGAEREGGKPG